MSNPSLGREIIRALQSKTSVAGERVYVVVDTDDGELVAASNAMEGIAVVLIKLGFPRKGMNLGVIAMAMMQLPNDEAGVEKAKRDLDAAARKDEEDKAMAEADAAMEAQQAAADFMAKFMGRAQ